MKLFVYLTDLLGFSASGFFAYALIMNTGISGTDILTWNVAPWLILVASVVYYLFGLYDFMGRIEFKKHFYALLMAQLVVAFTLICIDGIFLNVLANGVIAVSAVFQLAFLTVMRTLWLRIASQGKQGLRAWIVVREMKAEDALIRKFASEGNKWFSLQGVWQAGPGSKPVSEHDFPDTDLIILSPNLDSAVKQEWTRISAQLSKEVLIVPEWHELVLSAAQPQQIDDVVVYSIVPPRLSMFDRAAKRAIDLFISSVLLLLASPIMAMMFVLIPSTSKGKALFTQERVGLDGKTFRLLKFRSMVEDAEKGTGPVLAIDRDARITKLGQFIRTTRIDELPQLINVLRGEMSLVGPRPEREFFIAKFMKEMPHYTDRLKVKPGLTGLAQVRGNYATSPADKLRYDLMYIRDYSPAMDLKLLFQTAIVVLQREASRGVQANDHQAAVGFLKRLSGTQSEMAATQD